MIWPNRKNFRKDGSTKSNSYQDAMEAFGPRASAGVLDLRPAFQTARNEHKVESLLIDYGHAYPLGNRIIAEALAEKV